MKQIRNLATVFAAGMLLAACSAEQTSFNIDDVPGRNLLMGKIVYNEGTTYQDGEFVYNFLPAANLELFIELDNSSYDSNLTGSTVISVVTDEEGNYSVELPAPFAGATARLRTAAMPGVNRYVVNENNEYVIREEAVIYQYSESVSIQSAGINVCNMTLVPNAVTETPDNCTLYAKMQGFIGQGVERYVAPERRYNEDNQFVGWSDGYVANVYDRAPNAHLIVTIDYSGYNYGGATRKQTYNVTTNAQGEFTLNVPVVQFPARFDYTIEVLPVQNYAFTHYVAYDVDYQIELDGYTFDRTYVDYKPVTLKGWEQASGVYSSTMNMTVPADVQNIEYKALVFYPVEGQEVQGYSPSVFTGYNQWLSQFEADLNNAE